MTREKAHEQIECLHINDIQTRGLHLVIDKIYDDFEKKEEAEIKDRLAELEKVILDCYLARGYKVNVGGWAFKINISTLHKIKDIQIMFRQDICSNWETVFRTDAKTTKEMFDEAIEIFQYQTRELNAK